MDEDRITRDYVAPLLIRKASRDGTVEEQDDSTQHANTSELENYYIPRSRFQNFLRASYPFQPSSTPSPTTVTLGLNAGDIILVHSIHTNGWADGTLLESGARGWLPTNYCEPYDYATMRPLLKAVTEFWDIIRSGNETDTALFHNHDYMRGMVAGVRFLLEKSNCLTREDDIVRQHDSVRKVRKMLLADLSNLVKAAKQMQHLAVNGTDVSELDETLDDMLLKAFQVVTRGVAFFDCWSEEVVFAREISQTKSVGSIVRRSRAVRQSYIIPDDNSNQYQPIESISEGTVSTEPKQLPTPVPSRRSTLTHRMSYTGRLALGPHNDLASEKLGVMYDAFLGVLASFLGSHMQSRSSSELLLTTHQALGACRGLLNVVESIIEHDSEHCEPLVEAKDAMCDRIADLVNAAKQVFRPIHASDEEMIYLPSEGMQLVSAATACVSCAGRCVAKARIILEYMGDFELELSDQSQAASPVDNDSIREVPSFQSRELSPVQHVGGSEHYTQSQSGIISMHHEQTIEPSQIHETQRSWTPHTDTDTSSPVSSTFSNPDQQPSESISELPTFSRSSRPFLRDVIHSTGSDTTLVSSTRDSGPSFVSNTSTRATSPDRNSKQLPTTLDISELPGDLPIDDADEAENDVMEQRYAHELMFNNEGRVIGGSLNAIVERLTAHDCAPEPSFICTIYLTFRLFTTPEEFAKALIYRFEYVGTTLRIASPVRFRVYNILKGWLESHWRHDCDEPALSHIIDFAKKIMQPLLPAAGAQLLEFTNVIAKTHQSTTPRMLSSIGRTSTSSTDHTNSESPLPAPVLSRTQLSALKSWRTGASSISILDFDPLELARQITIKESALFCSILPEELLSREFTKQTNSLAVNVRAMAQLSTDLANLVADSILVLEEPKKRAATIKQWVKVANKCLELNNYDTLMAIICSINSSTILRLKKTWDLVNIKTKNCFEGLKKVVDVSKNYSTLRQRISGHVPPCLPFVGMYLTDLTFVDHGNSDSRELKNGNEVINVVNLDKHTKTAKIVSDLQRFQISYRLTEVSELQTWLQDELIRVRATGERNFQNHYRRSLLLEPRETLQSRPTTVGTFASITGKEKFDFLAWTHISRDKTTSVTS